MKYAFLLSLSLLAAAVYGQKKDSDYYNRLTEVTGSTNVMATLEDWSKKGANNNHLLFINTATGQQTRIEFPKDSWIGKIEQIRIDSLNINRVLVVLRTDYADNKFIDLRERPQKMILLSPDGQEKSVLTADDLLISSWVVNRFAGTITIAGYFDLNRNGKRDGSDKQELLIFDLKTLKAVTL